ncbi:MAG: hypothetical protein ABSD03_11075 [Vulcanimicrobiaceae bacterium]|jgi:hypothetical protein
MLNSGDPAAREWCLVLTIGFVVLGVICIFDHVRPAQWAALVNLIGGAAASMPPFGG